MSHDLRGDNVTPFPGAGSGVTHLAGAHIHDLIREIRDEVGSPQPDQPWTCPECHGRSSHPNYLGTDGRYGSDGDLVFDHTPCELCHGTGFVCPTCKGAKFVVRDTKRKLTPCPTCNLDGHYSRYDETKGILNHVKQAGAEVLF